MAKTVPVANGAAVAVRRAVAQERAASKTLESRFLSTTRLSHKSPSRHFSFSRSSSVAHGHFFGPIVQPFLDIP
jgi:hypothetical protein